MADIITDKELKDKGIHPRRVTGINDYDGSVKGRYVLYWMQASCRQRCNSALEYAIMAANKLKLPLVVCYVIVADYPGAMFRHYHFLTEGLRDVAEELKSRGIKFVVQHGGTPEVILNLSQKASLLVTDCAYLRLLRKWRQEIYNEIQCAAVEVEDNVVVPVEVVSDKQEYAARTIRPKIILHINEFASLPAENKLAVNSTRLRVKSLDISSLGKFIGGFAKYSPSDVNNFIGGQYQAKAFLDDFIKNRLKKYQYRNDPNAEAVSKLSPYLHFGMINPVEVMLAAKNRNGGEEFIEQLVVRRELAVNLAYYNLDCRDYESVVPDWAKTILAKHINDKRPYIYTLKQLENAQTHDSAWNAAQMQMVNTGYMHGYMRMYWGKKVIEWSKTPQKAFETLVYLNDKYELDGRDPNGYCGIAWCFGTHDRPWASRPIFGTVRYMNYQGLKRKFDVDKYCQTYLVS